MQYDMRAPDAWEALAAMVLILLLFSLGGR